MYREEQTDIVAAAFFEIVALLLLLWIRFALK